MMRTPPNSEPSESAVISIALTNPSVLARGALHSDTFFSRRNSLIWDAILRMYVSGKKIDYITVAKQLQDEGQLEACGGIERFQSLNKHEHKSAHYSDYCEILEDAYRCRQEIDILETGIERAYDGDSGAVEVIGKLASIGLEGTEDKSLYDHGVKFIEDCKAGNHGSLPWWDDEWTLQLGKLTSPLMILHAPRSTGKTALMLQWITKLHRCGQRAPLASIEMLRPELLPRLISNVSGVCTFKMQVRGSVTTDEERRCLEALESIRAMNLCIRDKAMTIDDVCTWAIREKNNGVDVLFIDNLLSISDGGKQYQSKTIMYDHFIRRLRDLRDQLGVPVVLLAHPNSEGTVAWSKDVENFADIILYLVEVPSDGIKIKSKGTTVMPMGDLMGKHILAIFQKNRQGECPMYASLDFHGATQTFEHVRWE